jgi:SAM-dependent methyltransferase
LPIASASLNFIIASHVLEHLPFPLAALKEWYRALAPGGALLVKIPDKRYTFDIKRPRTPLKRLRAEHDSPESFDWQAHYIYFVEHVDGRMPDESELSRAVPALRRGDLNIHYQVWIDEDLQQIVRFTKEQWAFDWQRKVFLRAHFYRKEATMLLVRGGTV